MCRGPQVAMTRANLIHIAMEMANSIPKLGLVTLDYCIVLVSKVNKPPIYRDMFYLSTPQQVLGNQIDSKVFPIRLIHKVLRKEIKQVVVFLLEGSLSLLSWSLL